MAVLNKRELAEIRQKAAKIQTVDWSKDQINLAAQIAEDYLDLKLSEAISAMPAGLPTKIKRQILRSRLSQRFKVQL